MDLDISRWIVEFVARKINDDNLIHRLFSVLPVPCDDIHLKKTILIKRIESEVSEGCVSQRTLDSLESIAELEKSHGFLITDSMKAAYCAAAVDCTVRFIEESGNNEGTKYFEMVKTLWRERMGRVEELGLDSRELRKWKGELERAISDDKVCRSLLNRNTRNAALREVRGYVNEAWGVMGPTFLEVAAREQFRGVRTIEANRDSNRVNQVSAGDNHIDELAAARKQVTGMSSAPISVEENADHDNKLAAKSDAARSVVKLPTAKSGDAPRTVKVNDSNDVNELVATRKRVRGSSLGPIEENGDHCNEVAASRGQGKGSSSNTLREVEMNGELPAGKKQAKGSSGGAHMTVRMNCTSVNELNINDRFVTRNENQVQGTQGKDKVTPQENSTHKRKHVGGPNRRHARAKIVDIEEGDLEPSSSKLDSLCTPAVNGVREELRSSMQELHAVVKDPLPGAIQIAERVACELASRRSSHVCISEKQTTVHTLSSGVDKGNEDVEANGAGGEAVQANGAGSEAVQANGTTGEASQADRVSGGTIQGNERNAESVQATEGCPEVPVACQNNAEKCGDEGNRGNQHARHQTDGPRPSLLERNHTARTYEWDDSIAGMPEQQPSSSQRIHLPSPESTVVEPLKRYELTRFARRRKRKRFSLTEEDTLREGVRKFGKGNWKLILNTHRDIFQDRTEVDLKDKWRNMTR